jgi:dimethylamine/trimethylamine dehydrogenase
MSTPDRYSILFEPVKIGPVTAPNRFYQVPHACGFGHLRPQGHIAFRAMKAEGGWGVVSTGESEIHPSSDLSPFAEQRIWDMRDVPALTGMVNAVHSHGALAALELVQNGHHGANLYSRIAPIAPSPITINALYPKQARAMSKSDIRELRRWHRTAVRNGKAAGFDIIYVYAGHHMTLAQHFMNPLYNQRKDEYGGSLENRIRLTRELLLDAQDEVAGDCAIALRLAVDHMMGSDGLQAEEEGRAMVEILAEIPDLWDINVAGWDNDSQTSRYAPNEGYQENYTSFVKQVTSKPVVAVGRYTSPDRMVSLIRKGHCDFIGAARASIADPFLPSKIRENRIEDICECIGCNICASSDALGVPVRCTQNPTIGEEWRRRWHPEKIAPGLNDDPVLVVGAGPAGLECAMQLSLRGHPVTLAESATELGGRALNESRLKGLSAWKRVCDYRIYKLQQAVNVNIYLDSELEVEDVLELGILHVFVATGAIWRRDGLGRSSRVPIDIAENVLVMSPDDIMAGKMPREGPVVIYDDEQGYMAGVIAEQLADDFKDITFISSTGMVSAWTVYTLEQSRIQSSLLNLGINIVTNRTVTGFDRSGVISSCIYGGSDVRIPCNTLIAVTEKLPRSDLADRLESVRNAAPDTPIQTLEIAGDGFAPGLIADAVFSGHLAARNFLRDKNEVERELFIRETPELPAHHQGSQAD